MKATIPIAISPGTRILRIERVPRECVTREWGEDGYWRIWLHANPTFTVGTYLQLSDDGEILKITRYPDGSESEPTTIKGPD
jgi:hypothetical protein